MSSHGTSVDEAPRPTYSTASSLPPVVHGYQLPVLPPLVQDRVLHCIVGKDTGANIQSDKLLDRLSDRGDEVLLYTTGDVRGLLLVIQKHAELSLNQRKDRFETSRSDKQARASASCS